MKMKMKIFIFLIAIFCGFNLLAQEEPQTQPLELPPYIIEGKEPISVQSGSKEFPDNRLTLSKMELDSLNSLEKQQSLLLPQKSFPQTIETFSNNRGYLIGEFGRFLTPKIDFGYDFNVGEGKIMLNAGGEYSGGHIDNSDYSRIYLKVNNNYIAPSKYWIFGGSRTLTNFSIKNNNYKLYADTNANKRNTLLFDLNISSDGDFSGYNFSTGAGLNGAFLAQTNHDLNNINGDGFLTIWTRSKNLTVGGNAYVNFGSFKTGVHFAQLNGLFNYKTDSSLSFNTDIGFQLAGNSINEEQIGFVFKSTMNYLVNKNFTLKAMLSNGLERNSLAKLLYVNPYISDSSNLQFENKFKFKFMSYYHPDEKFSVGIGLFFGLNNNTPYFEYHNDGSFLTKYDKTQEIGANLEGCWTPNDNDQILFDLMFNNKTLSENQNIMPNHSPINIYINYSRKIFDNLKGNFGIKYVGEKFGDIENKRTIDGFIDMSLGFEYKINNKFNAFIRFDNLLNSNIYYLEEYSERGLYGALGVNVIF
jgi:hypothetical protein